MDKGALLQTRPIVLMILDGWGIGEANDPFNAVEQARTPHLDLMEALYPATRLACSGEAVGLPDGQMGNSEVGHLNIGAGRVVYQELTRITKSVRDGEFFANPVLKELMEKTAAHGGRLHLMGLLSDGGVHSHIDHLYALLAMAKQSGVKEVLVHAFLDGRDVPPTSGAVYLKALTAKMREIGIGRIATLTGRYYAMDRDNRWERVEKAYRAIALGEGVPAASAEEALQKAYQSGVTDEFVEPFIIDASSVQESDGMIFFNFRPDRARQLTRAFVDERFDGFARPQGAIPAFFASLTQYDATIAAPAAFPPEYLQDTLGETLAKAGLKQLRMAETEKYAHVTFFFNGGDEKPNAGEDRILIPSPKVATYDLQPEMSAGPLTERLLTEIDSGKYDVIIVNYANPDMVGHTGVFEAAVKAMETVDACVGRVAQAVNNRGGVLCITADHGNSEKMRDKETHDPYTAHTTNDVRFLLVGEAYRDCRLQTGKLADIAPTVLALAALEKPAAMTGRTLLVK